MKIELYEEMWRKILANDPGARSLYPRRIAYPHGYLNPMYYSLTCYGIIANYNVRREISEQTNRAMLTTANQILEHKLPVFFVDVNFLSACDATNLPPQMTFEEIHWPLPALLLSYPVEWIQRRFGWPLAMAACCRTAGGNIEPCAIFQRTLDHDPQMGTQNPMCLFHFPHYQKDGNPTDYASRYPEAHPLGSLNTSDAQFEDCTAKERKFYNQVESGLGDALVDRPEGPTHEQEIEMLNGLTVLTAKVLLAMTHRPHLITMGSQTRKEKRHNGVLDKEALWSPNLVGHGYQIKRSVSAGGEGTHASPRMHWRCGHWHYVVHGKGRTQRKLDWFQPVLVNAPSE